MEITSTFNAAAGGPSEGPATVEGSSGGPDRGGGAAAEEHARQSPEPAEEWVQPAPQPPEEFAEAAAGGDVPAADEGPKQAPEPPPLTTAQAEAELEQLEAGRPAPKLRDDFDPPRKLQKIVHSGIERERENRISALKAYLEFAKEGPRLDHTPSNSPEPAL